MSATPAAAGTREAAAARPGRRPGVLAVYRWELRKLRSQKRTYIGVGAAMLLPILFTVVLSTQSGGPEDMPLAASLRISGVVVSLVVLAFASHFAAQLLVSIVAADIVATESSGGTLKLVLTRSVSRRTLLTGKLLTAWTYVVLVLAAMLGAGLVSGIIAWGFHPFVNIDLMPISAGRALFLTVAGFALFAIPLCAIAAFAVFLSTVTRNTAASLGGTMVFELVQEAVGGLVNVPWLKRHLLSRQFDVWEAVFHSPTHWGVIVRALWVSAVFAAVPLGLAYWVFGRRDVTGE